MSPCQGRASMEIGASCYAKHETESRMKCCCSFKTMWSPFGSKACSVHTAAATWSCLHHISVCQCEKASSWTKDWTTVSQQGPQNKEDLSPLSSFPLSLLRQHSQRFQIHWQRILCISIPAVTWWSRATLAYTFVPGAGRHHPRALLCKLVHRTLST